MKEALGIWTPWPLRDVLKRLSEALPVAALVWLGVGSLVYSLGAIICVANRPHIHPRFFNAHDLWHILVLAGSACQSDRGSGPRPTAHHSRHQGRYE